MSKHKSIVTLGLLVGVLTICCSDGDRATGQSYDTGNYPDPPITRRIDNVPIDAMRSAGINYLSQAASYVDRANAYANYEGYFKPTPTVSKADSPHMAAADTTVHKWTIDRLEYWLTYVRGNQDLHWSTTLNGEDNRGIRYDTALIMEADQKIDSTSGSMTLRANFTAQPVKQWNWRQANDYFGLNMSWNDGDTTVTLEIRHNSDMSGFVRMRRQHSLRLEVSWDNTESSGLYRAWNAERELVGVGSW